MSAVEKFLEFVVHIPATADLEELIQHWLDGRGKGRGIDAHLAHDPCIVCRYRASRRAPAKTQQAVIGAIFAKAEVGCVGLVG